MLIDQLNSLGTGEPLTVRQLEDNMRDASLSPMIVMLLRMLASAEIQRRGDFFYPFILARRGPVMHDRGGAACAGQCHSLALRRPVLSLPLPTPRTSHTRFPSASLRAGSAGPCTAALMCQRMVPCSLQERR